MKLNGTVIYTVVTLFIAMIVSAPSPATAQITISKSHFEDIFKVGSRMHILGMDGTTSVNVGKKGGPNIYDFRSLPFSQIGDPNIYRVTDVPALSQRYDPNAFSFGESTNELENNPVIVLRGDTLLMLGVVEITTTSQLVQHFLPPPVIAIFPGTFGTSWTQSYVHRETTFVGSQVTKIDSRTTTQNFTFDGYGTLRLPDRDMPCLRLVARDQPGGTADLTFHYLTQEGYWFEVRCGTSQPDTGLVSAEQTRLLMKESLVYISNEETVPKGLHLRQNYPNPFNPVTKLEFSLAHRGRAVLSILDLFGREQRVLFDEEAESGRMYQAGFDGTELASGVYVARLVSGESVAVRKILLLK